MLSKLNVKNISKERLVFLIVLLSFGPAAIWARFYFWSNALIEPHPWRQTQTALTIMQLVQGTGSLWDYRSPLAGMLWNNVYEFPVYQWVVSRLMLLGLGLEVSSRLITVISFGVSGVFGGLIIKDLLGERIAKWFLLLYFINPFGVVFSRVCLIDFFALGATLVSVYGAMQIRSGLGRSRHWLSFFAGGLIAGLAKINIWFFPTFALMGIVLFESLKKRRFDDSWKRKLFGVLGFQIIMIFWWNYYRVTEVHSPADTPWLIGELSQRFDLWRWKKILWDFGVRSFFYDFLIIPFFIGNIVAVRYFRNWFLLVWGIWFAHTLIFFQVQTYHDYYLIATMPYLYGLAAVGMDYLCRSPSRSSIFVLAFMMGLMVFKLTKLPVYFSPILHDYRPDLAPIFELKSYTGPEDLIYWDAKQGRFEIATYSGRKVGLSETFKLIGSTSETGEKYLPTVFRFDSDRIPMEVFKPYKQVWLEGNKSFLLYRTESKGIHSFDPQKHLAVMDGLDGDFATGNFQTNINNCDFPVPLVVPVPEGTKEIRVVGDGFTVRFPGDKQYLTIPNYSDWGCKVTISPVN